MNPRLKYTSVSLRLYNNDSHFYTLVHENLYSVQLPGVSLVSGRGSVDFLAKTDR